MVIPNSAIEPINHYHSENNEFGQVMNIQHQADWYQPPLPVCSLLFDVCRAASGWNQDRRLGGQDCSSRQDGCKINEVPQEGRTGI